MISAIRHAQASVIQASDGWRIARLDGRQAARPASFEFLRDELMLNWKTDETRKRAWDAVTKLKTGYNVKIEQ